MRAGLEIYNTQSDSSGVADIIVKVFRLFV
jgi:hypothetical protein